MSDFVVSSDPTVYHRYFEELAKLIAVRNQLQGFRTQKGGIRRDVAANEFMYMCHNDREVQFKHHDTRNYVHLLMVDGEWMLSVPVTDRPFQRGYFDKY